MLRVDGEVILLAVGVVVLVAGAVLLPFTLGKMKGDTQIINQSRNVSYNTRENYLTETNIFSQTHIQTYGEIKEETDGQRSGADDPDIAQENPNTPNTGDNIQDSKIDEYMIPEELRYQLHKPTGLLSDENTPIPV